MRRPFPRQFIGDNDPWSLVVNPEKYRTPTLKEITVTLLQEDTGRTWNFSQADNRYQPTGKYFNVNLQEIGVGPGCIIFRPDGPLDYNSKYTVQVTGLRDLAGNPAPVSYSITFFDLE